MTGGSALLPGYACQEAPAPEDTVSARQILLDGLARDAGISGLVSELAPRHPRASAFPGEVFPHLAADALGWCGASRSGPLAVAGLRGQFLPGCTFRGRRNKEVPVRGAGRGGPAWRDRTGSAG